MPRSCTAPTPRRAGPLTGKPILAKAAGREKYGRALVDLFVDGVSLNRLMVDSGHAVPYLENR